MTNLSFSSKRILREGAWSAFGKIATALGTLAGLRLITEFVPKEVYGTVSLLVGIVTLGSNLLTAPLILSAKRFHPEAMIAGTIPQFRRTITGILKWTVAALVCLILIGGALYSRYQPISYLSFLALAGFLIVDRVQALEISLFGAARRQKACAIWSILQAWLKPVLTILAVTLLGATAQSVLLGYFTATGIIILCVYILPVRLEGEDKLKQPFAPDKKLLQNIRHYAVPLIPLAIVGWIIALGDRYLIGGLLGVGEVGVYAACYGLISMPFLLTGATIHQTLCPPYFQAISIENKIVETKMFKTQLLMTISACGLGLIAVFLLRQIIAVTLLAEEYRTAAPLMPWIAAGISFQVISQVFENVIFAYKQTRLIFLIHLIGSIVCIVSVFILIRRFGLLGAAMACPVYYLSMLITSMILAKNIIKLQS